MNEGKLKIYSELQCISNRMQIRTETMSMIVPILNALRLDNSERESVQKVINDFGETTNELLKKYEELKNEYDNM